MQPIIEFSGSGPVMHIAPANGFPPPLYLPMLRPFLSDYRVVGLPPRALWPGEKPPTEPRRWEKLADDILTGMHDYKLTDVIAIGHSFGGVASLIAASREPERFRALCLLDATILPPAAMEMMVQIQASDAIQDFPLAQGARRRRQTFESAAAAYDYFKAKTLFKDWPDEAVRLYAEVGTRPAADGQGVELVWPSEWEAYYFSTIYTDTWDVLPKLRDKMPIMTIRGGESDTLLPEAVEKMQQILPEMAYAEMPGHGHLFPQTAPQETAGIIQHWLGTL